MFGKSSAREDRAPSRRRLVKWGTAGAIGVAASAMMANVALGSHEIDLTAPGAAETVNDAIFQQADFTDTSLGTGQINSFLRINGSGAIEGFNTDAQAPFDALSGNFTKSLLLSEIPTVTIGGETYREIWLDINEPSSESLISVDEYQIFTSTNAAHEEADYDPSAPSLGAGSTLQYDLDGAGDVYLMLDYNNASGSGTNGDMVTYVPESVFADVTNCAYGSTTCSTYFYLYSLLGLNEHAEAGAEADAGGFEEFFVIDRPVLAIEKTAELDFTRTYDWTIEKSVTPESHVGFNGDSFQSTYTVTVTKDQGTDSNTVVSGEITITNTGEVEAEIASVTDVLDGFGAVDVDCGVTFPHELDEGDELVCTYSEATGGAVVGDTNTATVTLTEFLGAEASFSDTASVVVNTPTLVNDSIDVFDDFLNDGNDRTLGEDVTSSTTFATYNHSFDCTDENSSVEGTTTNYPNTASTSLGDTDTALVQVTCYELTVAKTAETSYTRDWDWTVSKERVIVEGEDDGNGDPTDLTLAAGQAYTITYDVDVSTTGFTDSDFGVTGTITVTNPAPIAATGVSVSDSLPGSSNLVIDCGGGPGDVLVDIAANGSASCTYSADLPDASSRTNTATASLNGVDSSGTADVQFGDPTSLVDECVDVVDDAATPGDPSDDIDLGQVCVPDGEDSATDSFTYTIDVMFPVCGEYQVVNTVSISTSDDDNDTDEQHTDSYTVDVTVPCGGGCSLTPGYWKTHNESFHGGAPADDTWLLLGDADGDGVEEGENETFYLSGQTYFEVMWTAPGGNVYYNLAHHYIAAILNGLNGADTSVIDSALASAESLFETYTPAEIQALKGKPSDKALRQQFVDLAGTLGAYNEGLIGPGHCDEDATSVA